MIHIYIYTYILIHRDIYKVFHLLSRIILYSKNWTVLLKGILIADNKVKKIFSPGPMVSPRSARKLSTYIVKAKLYTLQKTIWPSKCRRKRDWTMSTTFQLCQNVIEIECFANISTGKTCKINNRFNCSGKYLIYLLTCQTCFK